ncbi:nanos homolog 1-like [Strongylocentrotus purpuratus]|uniref:Nanos-type domain-containing protein n=1 Tax=Strongylocentrotus purpuratus TaxID=7668 RepID=A0A7M7NUR3_STRPU|nr:nanos homolog 1-like [Strongylocentrotus purpuratus]
METSSWDLFMGKGLNLSEIISSTSWKTPPTMAMPQHSPAMWPSSPCPSPPMSPWPALSPPMSPWPALSPSSTVPPSASPPPSASSSPHEDELIFRSSFTDTLSVSYEKKRYLNTYCVFCKNNKETLCFYSSHVLKDDLGNVQCPVLRAYKCPICGAKGDNAHTVKYCPQNSSSSKAEKLTKSSGCWSDYPSPPGFF